MEEVIFDGKVLTKKVLKKLITLNQAVKKLEEKDDYYQVYLIENHGFNNINKVTSWKSNGNVNALIKLLDYLTCNIH